MIRILDDRTCQVSRDVSRRGCTCARAVSMGKRGPRGCLHHAFVSSIDRAAYQLGAQAARRPLVVIACATAAALILACGVMVNFTYITDAELMWCVMCLIVTIVLV